MYRDMTTEETAAQSGIASDQINSSPKIHPLFPGSVFISTVLDALESKDTMTGKMRGIYLQRAFMAGVFAGLFFTTYFVIIAKFAGTGSPAMAQVGSVLAATTFGWALVLIYYTNSELLTSNMMVVSIGAYYKRITWLHGIKMLLLCLIGNLAGGLLIAALVRCSSVIDPATFAKMTAAVATKSGYLDAGVFGISDLLVRAIFCNFCINIAMLMVYNGKLSNDFTKCIIMVVAVFVFAFMGFEHSIADSILFEIMALYGAVEPLHAIGVIAVVIIGNFIGGGLLIGVNFAVMNNQNTRHARQALKAMPNQLD
ncbi:formate/nitrite transporter [Galliscardovia ingluviei]|uniref:Formate/nitrite transporter n=2 Tax=Galliscardovia ingluviei TaxID=1769422 RepID=A0A8J3AFP2_9BIFI|nr:formate/nitrite transporter [Galliscardovia ingluviei]